MKHTLNIDRSYAIRAASLLLVIAVLTITSTRLRADTGNCGGSVTLPFTDVPAANIFFCSIAEAFFAGLTNGTGTGSTYSPSANVNREQMAAFITRTLDQSLRRGSPRAAMKRFWLPDFNGIGLTTIGDDPKLCECDGADVWVANNNDDTVSRVRASDGALLQTWTGADNAFGVVVVNRHIYVTGKTGPLSPRIYDINAQGTPGAVAVVSDTIGGNPEGIAYDGFHLWTANASGSVSRVRPGTGATTNFTTGFSSPRGILFDGTNIWVTDDGDDTLKKLDNNGNILQTVPVGDGPRYPVYDGMNIWVPNQTANTMTVVRASTGQVLATLPTVIGPVSAAFDGERILIVGTGLVAINKAADLGFITTRTVGPVISNNPLFGTCSDGIKFFFTVPGFDTLVAF
jgi:hypothetical protein